MVFRYPLFVDVSNVKAGNEIQQMFSTINGCIHEIHFDDQIFNKTDMTEKEIDALLQENDEAETFEQEVGINLEENLERENEELKKEIDYLRKNLE